MVIIFRSQRNIPRMDQLSGSTCVKNPLFTSMATQFAHVHQTRLENMPNLETLPVSNHLAYLAQYVKAETLI